jgi:pimeloyl-ACP methyl ester carboxylesterase
MLKYVLVMATALLAPAAVLAQTAGKPAGQYATVNGLKMYYQVQGQGRPLVLLHGGFMNIEALGPILPALAESRPEGRRVIAVDLEGHGRTVDLDRPLSLDQMAADVAGLLKQLGIDQADVFGFSMGGGVALRLAAEHPELVRKLVVVSAHHKVDAFYPSVRAMWPGMSPEGFAGTPMEQAYLATAPDPKRWPIFVEKMKQFMLSTKDWPDSKVRSIKAPTLLVLGDADLIRPEAMIDMFRLMGGARPDGGMGGVPASQLAVLPGTTHFNILYRTDLLLPLVVPFLDS